MVFNLSRSWVSVMLVMTVVGVSRMYLCCFLSSRSHNSFRGILHTLMSTSSCTIFPFLGTYLINLYGTHSSPNVNRPDEIIERIFLSMVTTGGLAGIHTSRPGNRFFDDLFTSCRLGVEF